MERRGRDGGGEDEMEEGRVGDGVRDSVRREKQTVK